MPTFSVGSNIDTGIAAHRVDTDLVLLADVDLSDCALICVDTASPVVSQVIACLSTGAPVTTHGVSTAVSTTSIILATFILICYSNVRDSYAMFAWVCHPTSICNLMMGQLLNLNCGN